MDRFVATLGKVWEVYHGMPVLYAWIQTLEEEILQYISNETVLILDDTIGGGLSSENVCFFVWFGFRDIVDGKF